jgi:hypothetical protein
VTGWLLDQGVYFPGVTEQKVTTAVLEERLKTAIAIGVVIAAASGGIAIFFERQLSGHGERLAAIETQVKGLNDNVTRLLDRRSKNLLTIPSDAATTAASAGDIKDAANWARQRKLDLPRNDLTKLGERLLTAGQSTPAAPSDLWGALSEVIDYRTELEKGAAVATLIAQAKAKPCASIPPMVYAKTEGQNDKGGQNFVNDGPLRWENCYLQLDDPNLPSVMHDAIRCTNCVVEYGGGQVEVQRAELRDCLFVIHIEMKPPERGLQLVQDVIQNPNLVTTG